MENKHISVLLAESIEALNLKSDSIVVDATLGYAGHSSEILKRIKRGHLFAFDQDLEAIHYSKNRLEKIGSNYTVIHANFSHMTEELKKQGITKVNAILFDLGVSSPQLDDKDRGFSYHQDARLDMRMDRENSLSAYEVVNTYSKSELTRIFYQYGEDKFSKNIASKIVSYRERKPIETTLELVEIIKSAVPIKYRLEKHPARQIFQAIRIEVNHELEILEDSINQAMNLLEVGGVLAVITFHSLEDKIIKKRFKEVTEIDAKVKGLPNVPKEYLPSFRMLTNKAIVPSSEELEKNPRARSSKLRVIERIK